MPINDLTSLHGLSPALIAVAIVIAIGLGIFINSRWLIVDSYTTYAIRVYEGIRRFPMSITWLRTLGFKSHEYVVKGKRQAARFEFNTRNRDEAGEWVVKKLYLMHYRTGAIDLRVHTMEMRPFRVASADHHEMEIHATLGFQLDRTRLFRCFQYANLGVVLLTRIEGFLRHQINMRQNEDVARELPEIRKIILEEMRKPEEKDNQDRKAWLADKKGNILPNAYFRATPSDALGIHITDLSLQVEQVNSGKVSPTLPVSEQQVPSLLLPPRYLDDMRDMFSRGGADLEGANEALLQVMEMHTRENIAKHLAKSNLIVISSDDLGMARTSVFRSKVSRAMQGDATPAQEGEQGKNK